jgi:hypothetical protein
MSQTGTGLKGNQDKEEERTKQHHPSDSASKRHHLLHFS